MPDTGYWILDAGVQYPKMVNGRKGIHVHSLKYETIEGYKHVGLDEKGVPYIQGTTMKVLELATENVEYKWDSEQLQIQHSYLTLGQIHSALAYYYDHKEEIEASFAEQDHAEKGHERKRAKYLKTQTQR